jgi:hypothetical protein
VKYLINNGSKKWNKILQKRVIYNHTINNPFDNNKKIVGAYCIIKNRCGEFISISIKHKGL